MQCIFHLDLDGTDQPPFVHYMPISCNVIPKVIAAAVSCPHWAVYRLMFTGPQSTRLQVMNLLHHKMESLHTYLSVNAPLC